MENEELEGKTLAVYTYVAKAGRPVGTRDAARGANLSSPSVAQRHLQKLEVLGLLEKNQYGDYILKERAAINGHLWIGKNVVPRLMVYSFFFIGALIAECVAIFYTQTVDLVVETNYLYLTMVLLTAAALAIFLVEGILLSRKSCNRGSQPSSRKKAN
jgi:hypothetical protein